ncbi:hypothetical protein IMF27_28535 [Pseudomonas sp. PCH199]|uniref:hypothetical protein n=1 Tax=unclassified Pseudomonas TaxID=196821 RepID=UPI000BC919E0|nr:MULTISPECIES: hypothetical protein [unclassified Pseudomonas]MCW8278978.1 hypothetical protein [Pseudomonas sp. PCH199]PAM79810.1 hypothetical protein CES87_29205 [Pseudomonas sp. ERMR1:02]
MSLTVGFPSASVINIGGKSPASVEALNEATSDTAQQPPGLEEGEKKAVSLGDVRGSETESAGSQSIAVKTLLKRMQELQQQLREQQQQLAATQAAEFPTPQAKSTAVMAIQSQIADTSAALSQVAAALVKELTKVSGTGSVISTTA